MHNFYWYQGSFYGVNESGEPFYYYIRRFPAKSEEHARERLQKEASYQGILVDKVFVRYLEPLKKLTL